MKPEQDAAALSEAPGDLAAMAAALDEAAAAGAAGDVPIGAVVVHNPTGTIIARGRNRREADEDPTAHAEVLALRDAGRALGTWRLIDCTLYVTLEPCPMCAGAAVNARVARLVHGCTDPKAGAVETLFRLCDDPRLNHRLAVTGGVGAAASSAMLKRFFSDRRSPRPSTDVAR